MTSDKMLAILDHLYQKVLDNGLPGFESIESLTEKYARRWGGQSGKVDDFISSQVKKAAATGFVTNLPGGAAMFVALPANIVTVLYIQVRMSAVIARVGGYDLSDDKVKTMVLGCLLGEQFENILKESSVQVGNRLVTNTLKKIPSEIIERVNKKIGIKVATKYGSKSLLRFVPLAGGFAGGYIDWQSTSASGKTAKKLFIE